MSRARHRVVFSETAAGHAATIAEWWSENRADAAALFADELHAAIRLLETTPRIGRVYARRSGATHRRILIGRSGYHLYWRVHDADRTVTITALWHAARGKGPPL